MKDKTFCRQIAKPRVSTGAYQSAFIDTKDKTETPHVAPKDSGKPHGFYNTGYHFSKIPVKSYSKSPSADKKINSDALEVKNEMNMQLKEEYFRNKQACGSRLRNFDHV